MHSNKQFWHHSDEGKAHEQVFGHVAAVEHEQRDIHEKNLLHARLYSNRYEPGLGNGLRGTYRSGYSAITENVIQSVVDTAVALIGKSRPKVTILTDDAEWSTQRLARNLDKYLWGMFRSLRVYDYMSELFRDACIFGTGALKVFTANDKICIERCLIDEIIVDESEVPSGGQPRQLHQVKLVSRPVLMEMFPDYKDEIALSSEEAHEFRSRGRHRQTDPDMVAVVESWKLPDGPDSPGRHTICVERGTLVDEEWTKDCFPFVFFHWVSPVTGFYGQGIAERLVGHQVRLNELNDFIRKCQDRIAVPRVYLPVGGKTPKPHIDNTIGAIIPVGSMNSRPYFDTPQALTSEIYGEREKVRQSAFEQEGVSRMAAQATRPEGIEAAVALRELSDNQSQRFAIQQQRYETAFLEVATKILDLASELHAGEQANSTYLAESIVTEIDWSEVDLEERKFELQLQASSILSETPAGRLQKVIELAQYGVQVPQEVLLRMLDLPDMDLYTRRATSNVEDVEWVIDQLSQGIYHPPEGFQDLALALKHVTAAYLDARRKEAPEEILEGFRQWLEQAQALVAPPQQPAAPGPGVEEGMTEGAVQNTGLPGLGGDVGVGATGLPGIA